MNIVFYIGNSWKPWDHTSIKTTGEGGSELATDQMSQILASRGHSVSIYNEPVNEGIHGKVQYLHHSKFNHIKADVLIASRTPGAVDDIYGNKFNKRILMHHDAHIYDTLTIERNNKFDLHFALSDWATNHLCMYYPFLDRNRVIKTSNGINTDLYKRTDILRDKQKLIWSSSPNRGLIHLLAMFPEIKKQVRNASLDVFYGFENWIASAKKHNKTDEMLEIKLIRGIAEGLDGVKLHGRVSPSELSKAQLGAGVWAYSTSWWETYNISAAECLASGMYPITTNISATPETLHGFGELINGDPSTIAYQKEFIDKTVKALSGVEYDRTLQMRYAQQNLSWHKVADQWEKLL
jgi:glycosyltransferase involved in cell wall biosynthesis